MATGLPLAVTTAGEPGRRLRSTFPGAAEISRDEMKAVFMARSVVQMPGNVNSVKTEDQREFTTKPTKNTKVSHAGIEAKNRSRSPPG
jgi:hypothetical protein